VAKAEQYAKLLNIEANCMDDMVRRLYVPAISSYASDLATGVAVKADIGIDAKAEKDLVQALTDGVNKIAVTADELLDANTKAQAIEDCQEQCDFYRDEVLPDMEALRAEVDAMEVICAKDYWPVPSYNSMLFYV